MGKGHSACHPLQIPPQNLKSHHRPQADLRHRWLTHVAQGDGGAFALVQRFSSSGQKLSRICKETGTPQLILVRKASIEGPVDRNI